MFAKSRKEKFVEQAQDLAHDLTEAIAPHVERARDEIAPRLAEARDELGPRIADARTRSRPSWPKPATRSHPDWQRPVTTSRRTSRTRATASPRVPQPPRRRPRRWSVEARRRGVNAAAALKGEPPVKRKGRKRKFFLFATLAGLGAFAVQKLRGGESANWQTSYSPSPAPGRAPGTAQPVRAEGRQPRRRRPGRLGRRGDGEPWAPPPVSRSPTPPRSRTR